MALAAVQRRHPGVLTERLAQPRMARRSAARTPAVDRRGGRRGGVCRSSAGTVAHRSTLYASRAWRTLHVQLDCELPDELAVGAGTAVFVCGWCFCPRRRSRGRRSCSTASRSRWSRTGCRGSTRSARCIRRSTRSRPATSTATRTPPTIPSCAATAAASGGWCGSASATPRRGARPGAATPSCSRRAGVGGAGAPRRSIAGASACGRHGRRAAAPRASRGWRSRWPPTTRRPTCSHASSTRSAPRPTTTGSA